VREQPGLLDDPPHPPPQGNRLLARDVPAENPHLARVGVQQPVGQLQRRRLASARATEQRDGLSLFDRKVEAVEDASAPEALVDAAILDGERQVTGLRAERASRAARFVA
jgi:hypothetical protein